MSRHLKKRTNKTLARGTGNMSATSGSPPEFSADNEQAYHAPQGQMPVLPALSEEASQSSQKACHDIGQRSSAADSRDVPDQQQRRRRKRKADGSLRPEVSQSRQSSFFTIPGLQQSDSSRYTSFFSTAQSVGASASLSENPPECKVPSSYQVSIREKTGKVNGKDEVNQYANVSTFQQGSCNFGSHLYDTCKDNGSSPALNQRRVQTGNLSSRMAQPVYFQPTQDYKQGPTSRQTSTDPEKSSSTRGNTRKAMTVKRMSSDFSLHEDCSDGNIKSLQDRLKKCPDVASFVSSLLEVGKVQNDSLRGTAAEVALQKGHLHCTSWVLGVILCTWYYEAPWFAETTNFNITNFLTKKFSLKNLLKRVHSAISSGKRGYWDYFKRRQAGKNTDVFCILTGACLLGHSDIMKILLQKIEPTFRENIRQEEKTWPQLPDSHSGAEVALRAAGLGSNSDCLKMVLEFFKDYVNSQGLEEALYGIVHTVWPWKSTQMKNCIDLIIKHQDFKGIHNKELGAELCGFIGSARKWIADINKHACVFAKMNIVLPTKTAILKDLSEVFSLVIGQIAADTIAYIDFSFLIDCLLVSREKLNFDQDFKEFIDQCFITVLSQKQAQNPLMGANVQVLLARVPSEKQKKCLEILCQFIVLTNRHKNFGGSPSCVLCHPLVNFVCRAQRQHRNLLTQENILVLGSYFRWPELIVAITYLRQSRRRDSICKSHRDGIERGHYPLYGNVQREEPGVLDIFESVPRNTSLLHMCLMTVLENLQGKASNLEMLGLPGGLKKYFRLQDFSLRE